ATAEAGAAGVSWWRRGRSVERTRSSVFFGGRRGRRSANADAGRPSHRPPHGRGTARRHGHAPSANEPGLGQSDGTDVSGPATQRHGR
ncbi:unnamed protein product, partial [Ectocarpus sp. 12 AP-2014]